MDTAEAATKSVVEHKGSAGRYWVFWGYLLNNQQDACTVQSEGLYGKCRVLKNTDERAFHGGPVPLASAQGGTKRHYARRYRVTLTRFSVPLIPNTHLLRTGCHRWTVQPFLAVRTAVLNDSLADSFRDWFPGFRPKVAELLAA
jgi:hypothetical protein